jgi:hypothetical protein
MSSFAVGCLLDVLGFRPGAGQFGRGTSPQQRPPRHVEGPADPARTRGQRSTHLARKDLPFDILAAQRLHTVEPPWGVEPQTYALRVPTTPPTTVATRNFRAPRVPIDWLHRHGMTTVRVTTYVMGASRSGI